MSVIFKIEGFDALLTRLREAGAELNDQEINKAVQQVADPVVQKLKDAYRSEGHEVTGALIGSIELYQRKKKGKNDPWYTYYIGPKYGGGKNQLSAGGNAAHLLEYGTAERHSADIAKGGATIEGRTYGAKKDRGKVKAYGTVRRLVAKIKTSTQMELKDKVSTALAKELTRIIFSK